MTFLSTRGESPSGHWRVTKQHRLPCSSLPRKKGCPRCMTGSTMGGCLRDHHRVRASPRFRLAASHLSSHARDHVRVQACARFSLIAFHLTSQAASAQLAARLRPPSRFRRTRMLWPPSLLRPPRGLRPQSQLQIRSRFRPPRRLRPPGRLQPPTWLWPPTRLLRERRLRLLPARPRLLCLTESLRRNAQHAELSWRFA